MNKTFFTKLISPPAFALALVLTHNAVALPTPDQPVVPIARIDLTPTRVPGQTLLHLYYTPVDAPPMPPSRVTVSAGDKIVVQSSNAPVDWPVQWLKNGQPISAATNPYLTIASVSAADAGVYVATFNVPSGNPVVSQALLLGVGPIERLANLSTWTSLPAGQGEGVIAGFIVTGSGSAKKMIVRAVGPSLAQFGFAHTLRQPVLRIRDANGKLYENAYVYTATIGDLTYETDLAASLAQVGAFTTPVGNADAVRLMPFLPGSYTVEITSADNSAGAVFLEIYEVP